MLTIKSIPNLLTGLRLAMIPVLWVFAALGARTIVGAGLALAWLTDALDGTLARRLQAQTAWGSRFDTIADTLMFVSGMAWIVMLRPDFVREHAAWLLIWLAIGIAAYVAGWVRFRRVADVHLYSAKAANGLGFLFGAYLLSFETYPVGFFYLTIGICIVAATETLLVMLTRERVDEHITTIFRSRRRGRRGGAGARQAGRQPL